MGFPKSHVVRSIREASNRQLRELLEGCLDDDGPWEYSRLVNEIESELVARYVESTVCYCCYGRPDQSFDRGTSMWDRLTGAGPYPDEIALCDDCYKREVKALNAGVWSRCGGVHG